MKDWCGKLHHRSSYRIFRWEFQRQTELHVRVIRIRSAVDCGTPPHHILTIRKRRYTWHRLEHQLHEFGLQSFRYTFVHFWGQFVRGKLVHGRFEWWALDPTGVKAVQFMWARPASTWHDAQCYESEIPNVTRTNCAPRDAQHRSDVPVGAYRWLNLNYSSSFITTNWCRANQRFIIRSFSFDPYTSCRDRSKLECWLSKVRNRLSRYTTALHRTVYSSAAWNRTTDTWLLYKYLTLQRGQHDLFHHGRWVENTVLHPSHRGRQTRAQPQPHATFDTGLWTISLSRYDSVPFSSVNYHLFVWAIGACIADSERAVEKYRTHSIHFLSLLFLLPNKNIPNTLHHALSHVRLPLPYPLSKTPSSVRRRTARASIPHRFLYANA